MFLASQPPRLSRGRNSVIGLMRMSVDPAVIALGLVLSCAVTGSEFGGAEMVALLIAFSISFPGEVSMRRLRDGLLVRTVLRWLGMAGLMLFLGYATRFLGHFDSRMLVTWFVLTPALLYGAHHLVALAAPQLLALEGLRRAVVVAPNEIGRKLARNMRDETMLGFEFVGYFGAAELAASNDAADGPLLGEIEDVARFVQQRGIETVFIALPMDAQPPLLRLLDELKDTTASIYFVPNISIVDLIQARIDEVGGIPVVAVCETPFDGAGALVKRASDLIIASAALVALAPLMLVVAAAVRLTSPGPALFRQRRYGIDGKEFVVLKFRSMRVTAESADVPQARADDCRVTRLGAWLRRTSIDELPQLLNVLRGDMSMVGPRPHAVAHNEAYRREIKGYMVRHKVKPGITGWAQVHGLRGETETLEKMRRRIDYDLDYLRRWSLSFDLTILLRTIGIVLRRTNAH